MIGKSDDTLGFLVHDAARMLRVLIDRRVEPFQITRAKWQVLGILDVKDGITQTELASALELERSTVGRLIDRLEERGFVQRRPDPKDRRVFRLFLLDTAKPLLEELEHIAKEVRSVALDGLNEADSSELARLLGAVKHNLQDALEGQHHQG